VDIIFLSDITKLDFASTVWKKVRNKEIEESDAIAMINRFEKDYASYTFIPLDIIILQRARYLLTKYGLDGLRTLDSIQFSSCIEIKEECNKYFTADKLLLSLFTKEILPI
jgi:uncharacterized protein